MLDMLVTNLMHIYSEIYGLYPMQKYFSYHNYFKAKHIRWGGKISICTLLPCLNEFIYIKYFMFPT